MKRIIIIFVCFIGFSTFSNAQSVGGNGAEKVSGSHSSGKSRKFKQRKQMSHFDSKKADPNIKNNGTSYRMQRRREQYEAENSGFTGSKR